MDDLGSGLVVLLLGDPHLLEGTEGRKDGATHPDHPLTLGQGNKLDLHRGGGHGGDLLLETLSDTGVHGGTTRDDDVTVKLLTDINVALHDTLESGLVDTSRLKTQGIRVEESLRAAETLVTNGDDVTVRKLVVLLEGGGLGSGLHLLLEVESNVTELLLDLTNNLTLGGGGEGHTTLSEKLHEVLGQVTAGQVDTLDGVVHGVTRVDGDNVSHTITGVKDNTGDTTSGVEGKDGLDGDVERGGVEGLEDDLGHLLTVALGVHGSLSHEDLVLLRKTTELVVEGVVPDLLHIVPVGNDTVLDGVTQVEDTTLALSIITNVGVLLVHTNHHTGVAGTANNRGEDGGRGLLTTETGLAHTRAVIHDQSVLIVLHPYKLFLDVTSGGVWSY